MNSNVVILAVALMIVGVCEAKPEPGLAAAALPLPYIAPYATSYNAHVVNHAIASPVIAAPARVVAAAPAPFIAAGPAPILPAAAYAAYPAAYPAPLITG